MTYMNYIDENLKKKEENNTVVSSFASKIISML